MSSENHPSEPNIINMPWSEFDLMSAQVISQLEASDFTPQAILSILRGGVPLGERISTTLHVPHYGIRIKRTESNEVFSQKGVPTVVDSESNYTNSLTGLRVLLVDDIATYGQTLLTALQVLTQEGASATKIATLIKHSNSSIQKVPIDFSAHTCNPNDWFIFPWEKGSEYE